ncbi:hypothetical protein H6G80_03185 [Nostoc sp. FACHB-87]|uniref:hypothetical protein n=1 Tax=Nostocaceae TaxID=1162 RepID=UPI001688949D|nr:MULTISPECIES: hypothetical protein [Nostocaceae]MBD2453078.1 hypothetical protein [Nostoc sp. FACHB-87]MBD2475143.1 hypothetical protein [Anabaena sp. FACHB-83]
MKSSPITSEPVVNSPSGSDKYEIQWSGASGKELFAGYSILSLDPPGTPMKVESIKGKLPHKVNFSASKNTIVSASGNTFPHTAVEIKIYKNGSECGKVVAVGSGVGANKVCE